MDNIIKVAHDSGVEQALQDFGIEKTAFRRQLAQAVAGHSNISPVMLGKLEGFIGNLARKDRGAAIAALQSADSAQAMQIYQHLKNTKGPVDVTDLMTFAPKRTPAAKPKGRVATPAPVSTPATPAAGTGATPATPAAGTGATTATPAAGTGATTARQSSVRRKAYKQKPVPDSVPNPVPDAPGELNWFNQNPGYTALGAGGIGAAGTYLLTRPDDSFSGRMKFLMRGN